MTVTPAKVTTRTALTIPPATDDKLLLIDISDTTDGSGGTLKTATLPVAVAGLGLTRPTISGAWNNAGTVTVSAPTVILFHGDSNMQGQPLNSSAQSWEVLSRTDLQILNNTGLTFENLDIGTNNAATALTQHGPELQLANCCRLSDLTGTIYCAKVAVSGSRISEWSVGNGTGYWTNFLARVAAIESQLGTTNIRWIVWNSAGVNEARDGITAAVYKQQLVSHFAKVRNRLGATTPILHLHIPTGFAEYNSAYPTKIAEVASEYADTYAISITSIAVEADNIHYTYQGLKDLTERLVAQTQTVLGYTTQSRPAITFAQLVSATVDGQGIRSSGAAISGGISNRAFSNEIAWSVVANFEGGTGSPVLVAIDYVETDNLTWNDHNYLAGFVWVSGTAYYGTSSAYITAATGFTYPSKVKFTKSGNDVLIYSTTDGGLTWTLRHTLTNAVSGKTALWVKVVFQGSSTGNRVKVNLTQ